MIKSILLLLASFALATSVRGADDSAAIIAAASDYVKKETAITDPVVTVEKSAGAYARVRVKSKAGATDPAIAFLKLADSRWTVLILGTAFEPADYKRLKIPVALQK